MSAKKITAFSGNDSSIYIAHAMAVADLLFTGDHSQCDSKTMNEAGGLLFMLLDAARKLGAAEHEHMRQRMLKAEAKA
jgi:hypothetical protein